MIKLELEIRDSEEMRATAQYLTELAEIHERRERSWREEQKTFVFPTTAHYGQAIAGGAVTGVQAVPETAPPETVSTKKRRARKDLEDRDAVVTKQPEAETEPVEAETEQPEAETEQPKAETAKSASAKVPSLEAIRAKAAALSQAGQGTSLRALMKKYNATNLTSLSAEQYPSFMNELEAMEVTDA